LEGTHHVFEKHTEKPHTFKQQPSTKLADITEKLHAAFKKQSQDVIEIGRLLGAAKKELQHGAFLPWLRTEFSLSVRSAERYMATHKFWVQVVAPLAKSAKMADFKLRPSALFALVELHSKGTLPTEMLQRLLSVCQKRWIGKADAEEMLGIPRAGSGAESPDAAPSNNADGEEAPSNAAEAKAATGAEAGVPTAEPSTTTEANAEETVSSVVGGNSC
jgi:hypothetical protein